MSERTPQHWSEALAQDIRAMRSQLRRAERAPNPQMAAEIIGYLRDTATACACWLEGNARG